MARDEQNQIDMTYLDHSLVMRRGHIHRDYMAHCTRWSHVLKVISPSKETSLLDVGCGRLAPLASILYGNRYTKVAYVGVDYGKIEPEEDWGEGDKSMIPILSGEIDFSQVLSDPRLKQKLLENGNETEAFDVIVSFEVLEHMQPDRCIAFLQGIREMANHDTTILISTPCFNGSAAKNHINEWTYTGLAAIFESLGFAIGAQHGTFASQRDYKDLIEADYGDAGLALYEQQKAYFDSNVLSLIWAPLYPQASRNVMWTLGVQPPADTSKPPRVAGLDYLPDWLNGRYESRFVHDLVKSTVLGQSDDREAWKRAADLVTKDEVFLSLLQEAKAHD